MTAIRYTTHTRYCMMQTVGKCDWVVSTDLKDVHFCIPIAVEHKRFRLFYIREITYRSKQ